MTHRFLRCALQLALLACACGPLPAASPPAVGNRSPQPDEVGYRPTDGAAVPLNPPSLIWLHETNAATYTVQWARKPDFSAAETARGFRWNTYTHHAPLTPGTYHWRYRFTTTNGETSSWSVSRSFTVPADATIFPMPTVAQQRARAQGTSTPVPPTRGPAAAARAGERARGGSLGEAPC